jgi:excisionase family DNA binding protein
MADIPPESYTIAETAALTGLHKNTIRLRIKMGHLPAERAMGRFGEEYRISRAALLQTGLLADETPPAPPVEPQEQTPEPLSEPAATATSTPAMPSHQALSDLFQRHEHAMFRLGFMEAELARHKALAENAESLRAAARERDAEIGELRRELERAQGLVREMEEETNRMREQVEAERTAAARRWWHRFTRRHHPDTK